MQRFYTRSNTSTRLVPPTISRATDVALFAASYLLQQHFVFALPKRTRRRAQLAPSLVED